MPGPLVHVLATGSCPHQGRVAFTTTNVRVFVNGTQAVLTALDIPTVAACIFQVPIGTGTKPQPCVVAQLVSAGRVFINGAQAVAINAPGMGLCRSVEQFPQGPPTLVTQTRVIAT